MLTLLLADAELERVPEVITGHQQVVTASRRAGVRPSKMLLDSSLHYAAMRKLDDAQRRGRPDLVHLFLLTALETPANRQGALRVLVHTRDDLLLRIDPTTRLIRNYNRFCGLLEQLFETRKVPPDKPLLTLESGWKLTDVMAAQKPDRVLVLDEQAAARRPWELFDPKDVSGHTVCVIGGFPSGTYRSPLPSGERIGLGPELLTVWTVAAELVVNFERALAEATPASGPT